MPQSIFLLELDYKIHIPAVEMMMEERYRDLFAMGNPFADSETAKKYNALMFGEEGIYKKIEAHYLGAHKSITEQRREDDQKKSTKKARHVPAQESDTLLTKILLGVYGCVPAYDRYFKDGIGFFGKQKLLKADGKAICGGPKALCTLLADGRLRQELDEYWQKHKGKYTFMKVVDMWAPLKTPFRRSARSFAPTFAYKNLEIHPVFLRFLTQNLEQNLWAPARN